MRVLLSLGLPLSLLGATAAFAAPTEPLTAQVINGAGFTPLPTPPPKDPVPEVVKAEVLLDRARFSPGVIDGIVGENFSKALVAYQSQMKLPVSGQLDQATWTKLTSDDPAPILLQRKITEADLKGPFVEHIPEHMLDQAKLKHLGYRSVQEELSEQYHTSIPLLEELNKGVDWKQPDTAIVVPQVVVDRPATQVTRIVVNKPDHAVEAYAADGRLVAFYPASIGSEEKPAPSGQFQILRVAHNPGYTYNPKYAFKGVSTDKPFEIAPGPNNPVGSVWMDLSDKGYGIHGTPDPSLVGKTQSHGCIRLTNWDAEDLASMASKGTTVDFEDSSNLPILPDTTLTAAVPAVQNPAAPPMTMPSGTAPAP